MSIKRYEIGEAYDHPCMIEDPSGEYVSYEDFMRVFKAVARWNNGVTPIGVDGVILIRVEEYNALINALNGADEL